MIDKLPNPQSSYSPRHAELAYRALFDECYCLPLTLLVAAPEVQYPCFPGSNTKSPTSPTSSSEFSGFSTSVEFHDDFTVGTSQNNIPPPPPTTTTPMTTMTIPTRTTTTTNLHNHHQQHLRQPASCYKIHGCST